MKFFLVLISVFVLVGCGDDDDKKSKAEAWPPGLENGDLEPEELQVFASLGLSLSDFDRVGAAMRESTDQSLVTGNSGSATLAPESTAVGEESRDLIRNYLYSDTCTLDKVDTKGKSIRSQGEKCELLLTSAIGETDLKTTDTGYSNEWSFDSSYEVLGDLSGAFPIESFSSTGSFSNNISRQGLTEYTAGAKGVFNGEGFSKEYGAFTTKRWGNYTANRTATTRDSDGKAATFEQSQNIRFAFTITSKLIEKSATLATEIIIDRLGDAEMKLYLNGKVIDLDNESYNSLLAVLEDLESPLVLPELPIF